MTDRELLELAARAACKDIDPDRFDEDFGFAIKDMAKHWNPLLDDGDALRLAVKLGLQIEINTRLLGDTLVISEFYDNVECHKSDPYAATRRAIVRAAAEIGKSMEVTK
jgi:hypothetical protein